jgi:hypothetical protein
MVVIDPPMIRKGGRMAAANVLIDVVTRMECLLRGVSAANTPTATSAA